MNYVTTYQHENFNMSGFTRTVVVQGGTLSDIFPPVPDMVAPDRHARIMIVVNDVLERPLLSTMVDLDIGATVAAWELSGLNPDAQEGAQAFKEIADGVITAEIIKLCMRAVQDQCEIYNVPPDERDENVYKIVNVLHQKAMSAFVSERLMEAAILLDDDQFNDVQNAMLSSMQIVSDVRERADSWTIKNFEGDQ